MKLSPHFTREEMACKCGCGFDTVDYQLLVIMEDVRGFIGAFTPLSVCRCEKHNDDIGGSKNSYHVKARACDIPCNNPLKLYEYLDNICGETVGLGLYYSWGVHVDTRGYKARWTE